MRSVINKEWKKAFSGETFVFDYYYMWDCYKDLGHIDFAKLIHSDISCYADLGFSGLISCQGQRVFYPTSLGMRVMADTLWNKNTEFDQTLNCVLESEFGREADKVKDFLCDMSRCSIPEAARLEKPFVGEENLALYEEGKKRASEFLEYLDTLPSFDCDARKESFKALKLHTELCVLLYDLYISLSKGENDLEKWYKAEDFANQNELLLEGGFDVFELKVTMRTLLSKALKRPI